MEDPHPERTLFLRDVAYWLVMGMLAILIWGSVATLPIAAVLWFTGKVSDEVAIAIAIPFMLFVGACFLIAWRNQRQQRREHQMYEANKIRAQQEDWQAREREWETRTGRYADMD